MSDKDDIKKLQENYSSLDETMSNVTENMDMFNEDIVKIEQMQDFILDGLIRVRKFEDYIQNYLTKVNVWSNEMDEAFSALEAGLVDIENDHKPLSLTLTAEEKERYAIRRKSHIIKLRLVPNSEDEFKKRWDKLAINEMEKRSKKISDKFDLKHETKKVRDPIREHLNAVRQNHLNDEQFKLQDYYSSDEQNDETVALPGRVKVKPKDKKDDENGNGDLPNFD